MAPDNMAAQLAPYPDAILFDLDDTLIDYSIGSRDSWREVCSEFADQTVFDATELVVSIAETGTWYWSDPERHRIGRADLDRARREVVRLALERLGDADNALADRMGDAYSARRRAAHRLFPRTIETLDHFKALGVRLGLVTNGSRAMQSEKVSRFGLTPYFDCVTIEGEFGVGKPDPRPFLHTLRRLGVAPQDAWMVGDNLEWDVAPPKALGIRAVWYDYRGSGLPEGAPAAPDRIIRDIGELIDP